MNQNVLDQISRTESLLGVSSGTSAQPRSTRSYMDDLGEETYYVENISSMDVILTDLAKGERVSTIVIDRGQVVDLTAKARLELIKDSQQVRTCLNDGFLKRLTKEEFFQRRNQKEENARRIEQARIDAANRPAGTESAIKETRFSVKNQVDKLKMYYSTDKSIASYGITPYEFMEWANTEKFQDGEIDYIVSMVDDADVRSFLYKRKQQLFG